MIFKAKAHLNKKSCVLKILDIINFRYLKKKKKWSILGPSVVLRRNGAHVINKKKMFEKTKNHPSQSFEYFITFKTSSIYMKF
jgi:hypothetical protein